MLHKRILVVDDEPSVLDSIGRVLRADRHQVDTASTGQEALGKLDRAEFDLVMVDLKLPDLSGDQVAQEISTRRPSLAVVLLTGTQVEGPLPGIRSILMKPFSVQELRETIAACD